MPVRPFGAAVDAAVREHARAAYPNEACGLVVNGVYVPVENIAADPASTFEIAPAEMLREGIQAIVHSHPDEPAWPSVDDMTQQLASGLPWGLVSCGKDTDVTEPWWWGPGIAVPPLVGRDFRHGPSGSDGKGDCYALIKDWYALERGIELPEFPRGWDWWNAGEDLYREGFPRAGFEKCSIEDLRPGDVLLAQVQSKTVNHGAIYLGNGLILHHLTHRLSREEPLARWMQFVTHALRHESEA